jgi:hypothetical protein
MTSSWDEATRWARARRISKQVKARLKELADQPWMFSTYALGADYCGLTYQSCRFCKRDDSDGLRGLWKYGVRHYICDECRRAALER